jgi:hypothetical protein
LAKWSATCLSFPGGWMWCARAPRFESASMEFFFRMYCAHCWCNLWIFFCGLRHCISLKWNSFFCLFGLASLSSFEQVSWFFIVFGYYIW